MYIFSLYILAINKGSCGSNLPQLKQLHLPHFCSCLHLSIVLLRPRSFPCSAHCVSTPSKFVTFSLCVWTILALGFLCCFCFSFSSLCIYLIFNLASFLC